MVSKKRLIDANAQIEKIKENVCKNCNSYDGIRCRTCWADDVIGFLEDAPTVDAVEVVHGEWINITDFGSGNCYGFCSVCRTEQRASNATALRINHKYCRWCGAKMDGEGRPDKGGLTRADIKN